MLVRSGELKSPIVDGDLVPDHPVKLAREGRSHPVPLIIGTNKHEAALFRWMKSPLMPITPDAIKAMFAEIAAEQPSLPIPSEADIVTAYPGRPKVRGLGVARWRELNLFFGGQERSLGDAFQI